MKILIACEPSHEGFDLVNLELLTAAKTIAAQDDEVIAFITSEPDTAVGSLGGADRVICAPVSAEAARTPDSAQAILNDVVSAEQPDIVLMAYSALGLDLAPWLAGKTGMGLVSYVSKLGREGDALTASSQIYGGKMIARCDIDLPSILSVMPGTFAPADATAANTIDIRAPVEFTPRIKLVSVEALDLGGMDLTKSKRILCAGRGVSDESGIEKVRGLADRLYADLAGSRPVVDSGMLEKQRQVGKSGQKVKPNLYVALGISGAPEHLEGMSGAQTIVAVNTDENAPIFNVAHYTATCDLFEFIDAVNHLLDEQPLSPDSAA